MINDSGIPYRAVTNPIKRASYYHRHINPRREENIFLRIFPVYPNGSLYIVWRSWEYGYTTWCITVPSGNHSLAIPSHDRYWVDLATYYAFKSIRDEVCWKSADIVERDVYRKANPIIVRLQIIYDLCGDSYPWPIFGDEQISGKRIGFDSESNLLLASLPQFQSGTPESEREDGHCDRGKGIDVIVGCVDPDKFQEPEDRFMHGGAGLIAGIIFGIIFIAYQYARKRI